MTRDQIMALEGRELDVAVEEHVMGIAVQGVPFIPRDVEPTAVFGDEAAREYNKVYPTVAVKRVPHHSTDIAAAWQVVEKLRGRGHWVDIRDDKPSGWRVSFGEEMTAHGNTAPEAICKAALLAVQPDVRPSKKEGVLS